MTRWLWLVVGLLFVATVASQEAKVVTDWPYQSPQRPATPTIKNLIWPKNTIDSFILARLEAKGLQPSAEVPKLTLLRRVTFDLTGLPPTIAEQEAFLADQNPEAYVKVVDRLLASPRFGERWAQHWLDLVRYAETDGFKSDDLRPQAHKYRDYVIQAFNDDLSYDRFIRQQVAGDELEPDNPQALIATGFNRLWPDENNAANLEQRRQEILDDVTDVTAQVFMGLTLGCARCHDHKFDPLRQLDYFRMQAFFAPMQARDGLPARKDKVAQAKQEAWEEATKGLRTQMDELVATKRSEMRQNALTKFRQEIQDAVLTPEEKRTPYQKQIAAMAEDQLQRAELEAPKKLADEKKKQFEQLEKQMAAMAPLKPSPPANVMALADIGRVSPPTHLLQGGDWRKPAEEVQPGFPLILGDVSPEIQANPEKDSTGRRAALAKWLTRPNHPLTARVMMNRLWQHHFGVGIVATPSDFGKQGTVATHPELLDWLATEFVANGWSLKKMHRLMVTSATYRQSSFFDPQDGNQAKAKEIDPDNTMLWKARRRRLEGEALRDAALHVAGELNERMYGISAKPKLPPNVSRYAWKPDGKSEDQNRRSIYVLAKRNLRYPLFEVFDQPDLHGSCACRSQTTTAPQALLLFNGEFLAERGQTWAGQLMAEFGNDHAAMLARAYQQAWGRTATEEEVSLGLRFLEQQHERLKETPKEKLVVPAKLSKDVDPHHAATVVDFCHAVLNANEFLYVD